MQGTASDIVKKAMIECFYKIPLNLILQIHDELIFEGAKEKIQHLKSKVISVMESVATLSVPLKVNANFGKNWDEAH
jgi:DNA polymerase-1